MENSLLLIQEEMQKILNDASIEDSVKVTKLTSLIKDVRNKVGSNTIPFYECASTIHEAIGDLWMKDNQVVNAEKAFKSMIAVSKQLYELSPAHDYRYGFSCYKMASFYLTILGCTKLEEKPKNFNDMQKQVCMIADSLYKTSITSTMSNARKGYVQYAQLQAMAMSEMALLYAAQGEYKMASGFGLDGVNVSKSVYNAILTKDYMYTLINRINHLATIYKLMHKEEKTIECLLDSISYAKSRLEEDKVTLGLMIGKCYMNVGACYVEIKEILKADDVFEKGLECIAQAHKDSGYRMHEEVIKTYIKVGNHYSDTKRDAIARSYFALAYEKASLANESQPKMIYKNLMEQLSGYLGLN